MIPIRRKELIDNLKRIRTTKSKMRNRRKKWAEKELQEAKFYIDKPEVNKGKWNKYFKKKIPGNKIRNH